MDMILQAFGFMLLGMGGVFVFLVVLVLIMIGLVRVAPRDPAPAPVAARPTAAAADDTELIAVMQAAVVAYESDRRTNGSP